MSSSSERSQALDGFNQLNSSVYLYTPPTPAAATADDAPPGLIVFCAWMGASPRNISKYTSVYKKTYPGAQILLIQATLVEMMFWSYAGLQKQLGPAVDVVRARAAEKTRILLHLFSNGGSTQATQLALAYRAKEGTPLPISAMALDSTPGKARFRRTVDAMVVGLPKNFLVQALGRVLSYAVLVSIGLKNTLLRRDDPLAILASRLVQTDVYPALAPRCYLYSEADRMVWYRDVEEHADTAQSMGLTVTKVPFKNSPHAGHILEDAEKYWTAIKSLWAAARP